MPPKNSRGRSQSNNNQTYEKNYEPEGNSGKGNSGKADSGILGKIGKLFGGGLCNTVFNILKVLEKCILTVFGVIQRGEKTIMKIGSILYIWKFLLLLALVIIYIAEWIPRLDGLFNKNALQAMYSVGKSINILIILLGTLFGASKISKKIKENDGSHNDIPFPLLLVGYLVGGLPVMYELLSLVALSSITLAYYTQKCGGKVPNAWGYVDTVGSMLMGIGIIGFILSFLQFRIKKVCGSNIDADLKAPNILILISINFLIIFMLVAGIEQTVANNVSYWLGMLGDSENPSEECIPDEGKEPDDGFTKIFNLVMSIIISIVLVIIIVIGCIPIGPLLQFNNTVKDICKQALDQVFALIY